MSGVRIKSIRIKSNQIKSNQIESYILVKTKRYLAAVDKEIGF